DRESAEDERPMRNRLVARDAHAALERVGTGGGERGGFGVHGQALSAVLYHAASAKVMPTSGFAAPPGRSAPIARRQACALRDGLPASPRRLCAGQPRIRSPRRSRRAAAAD